MIQVDDHLQVEGHPNWSGIGDITSLTDCCLGRLAVDQGKLVSEQIKLLHKDGQSAKLKLWKRHNGLNMITVSLGRNHGATDVFGWGFSGWLPTWLKSRDLSVATGMRENMGLPAAAAA